MRDKEARIEAAKRSINECRKVRNMPEAQGFAVIEFHNGFVVMPQEDFLKLSKAKQKKLMK